MAVLHQQMCQSAVLHLSCRYILSWQSLVDIITIVPIFLSVFLSSRVSAAAAPRLQPSPAFCCCQGCEAANQSVCAHAFEGGGRPGDPERLLV